MIWVSGIIYELFLDQVDPWRRELQRARKQLAGLQ
jgi:hypothetical protein